MKTAMFSKEWKLEKQLELKQNPKTERWNNSDHDAAKESSPPRSNNAFTAGIVVNEEKHDLTEDEMVRLRLRRKLELELVGKYDVVEINPRKECWFIIDSVWLNSWAEFVRAPEDDDCGPPGPMSTKNLLDESGSPIKGLVAKVDFRAVCPLIYFIFVNLYTKDKSPDICRYTPDIYLPPVAPEKLVNIYMAAENEAKVQVNKIRTQWVKWELPEEVEEDESVCCGFITKEHIIACIYWASSCWRKGDGRKNIKYSNYRPLAPPGLDSSAHSIIHQDEDCSTSNADAGYSAGYSLFR